VIKFSKKSSVDLFRCNHGFLAKCPIMQSLHGVPKISSFELKLQRESENQGCFKSMKKCQSITLEKWVFEKAKFNP